MNRPFRTLAPLAALALALAAPAPAEIKAYDLRGMLAEAGGCVFGRIVDKKVQRVVHPQDGELYFTSIFVEGECLLSGKELAVEIKYMGGFVDDEHGAYNSEAPSEDATRIGRRVVAFYGWVDKMGGGVSGNQLWAMHGGLFTSFERRGRTVVQGRGAGYAISCNCALPALREDVRRAAQRAK